MIYYLLESWMEDREWHAESIRCAPLLHNFLKRNLEKMSTFHCFLILLSHNFLLKLFFQGRVSSPSMWVLCSGCLKSDSETEQWSECVVLQSLVYTPMNQSEHPPIHPQETDNEIVNETYCCQFSGKSMKNSEFLRTRLQELNHQECILKPFSKLLWSLS